MIKKISTRLGLIASVTMVLLVWVIAGTDGFTQTPVDCSTQNIFFPLSPGAVWKYRLTIIEDGEIDVLDMIRTFYPSSLSAEMTSGILVEKLNVYGGGWSMQIPVKIVNRAVFQGEISTRVTAPDDFDWRATLGGGFQLHLPDMRSLSLGTKWSRSSGIVVQELKSKTKLKGSVSEQDLAEFIALEFVNVPAGRFMALKLSSVVSGQVSGLGGTERSYQWFAPGVGLVKEMSLDGSIVRELVSFDVSPCCGFVVTTVQGDASINGKPAEPGMGLSGSAILSVGRGGSMNFSLGDGTTIKVAEVSDFSLQTICSEIKKEQDRTLFDIIKGKLYYYVNKTFSSGQFQVKTPTTVVGVRGTEFSVEVIIENGGPVTIIEVIEGQVWVRPKGTQQEIVLEKGTKRRF